MFTNHPSSNHARSFAPGLLALATLIPICLLVATPAAGQYPGSWPADADWHAFSRFGVDLFDPEELGGATDISHDANPGAEGDLWSGQDEFGDPNDPNQQGPLPSAYIAFDSDNVYLRMRLENSPVDGAPGGKTGPYLSSTAWIFIFDLNGDGWIDFGMTVDGNTGTQQDYYDYMKLVYMNTPGTHQIADDAVCDPNDASPSGQVIFKRKCRPTDAEDPNFPACTDPDGDCDFEYTRSIHNGAPASPKEEDYLLDMQFPIEAFDDGSPTDADSDGYCGDQLFDANTPFMVCVTTSTQPNDLANKDFGLNYAEGAYSPWQGSTAYPMPCMGPCTLNDGCDLGPTLTELEHVCGPDGDPNDPNNPANGLVDYIDLTAHFLAALELVSGMPEDEIYTVSFYYWQAGDPSWTSIATISSADIGTDVNGGSYTMFGDWSHQWDTSGLDPNDPNNLNPFRLRVEIIESNDGGLGTGRTWDSAPIEITLDPTGCGGSTPTPVTIASFEAVSEGPMTDLSWSTATEAGTVGFNLYGKTSFGWIKANRELIPSKGMDSTEPQLYSYTARLLSDSFIIEEVDIRGGRHRHGPFTAGVRHGEIPTPEAVDWKSINASHERQAEERRAISLKGAIGMGGFPSVELLVNRDGLFKVTYEELLASGFDLSGASAKELALVAPSGPVAIRVGGGDVFGPGSFVELMGEGLDTLHTDTNHYRLLVDAAQAERIREVHPRRLQGQPEAFYMESLTVERDLIYSFAAPTGDPWYDTKMYAYTTPLEWSFDLDVDGYVAGAAEVGLSVKLWGVTVWPTKPDHHVVMTLNGVTFADELFDNQVEHEVFVTLPAGVLQEGRNTLTLTLPGDTGVDFEVVALESYTVTYPRAFTAREGALTFTASGKIFRVDNLPDPDVVVYQLGAKPVMTASPLISGVPGAYSATFPGTKREATYMVAAASALSTPILEAARPDAGILLGRADYLIISHGDFIDSLSPLVSAREAQGLRVKVVDVADIYAQLSGSIVDPEAIRTYIAHAATAMGTRYVLLVGGDTYDYKDNLGLGSISFVPSLYTATGDIVKYAPADPLYTDLNGDNVPDLAIGRFPVRTVDELHNVITKTLQYEVKVYDGTAVFAADAVDTEAGFSFSAHSEVFLGGLPAGWKTERAYMDNLGLEGARKQLIGSINSGVALTSFVGHSGMTHWSTDNLFRAEDALALYNFGAPTTVVQWGCWNTYHVDPRYNTLGHTFLLADNAGAAAVLGSATLAEATSTQELSRLLAPLIAQPGMTIGQAVTNAKQQLASVRPDLRDVLLGWTLLGDPALMVEAKY